MRARRHPGRTGGEGTIRRISRWGTPRGNEQSVDVQRYETREGIRPRTPPATLNATEVRVSAFLDAEFVSAQNIAALAGVSVYACRRALGALREKGIAEAERRGQINVWRAS